MGRHMLLAQLLKDRVAGQTKDKQRGLPRAQVMFSESLPIHITII